MIQEDYVSFEIAKLLKKNGFNEGCHSSYDWDGNIHHDSYFAKKELVDANLYYWAPTLQMATKWLREVHGYLIIIKRHYFTRDVISHVITGFNYLFEIKHINTIHTEGNFASYEQAIEEAIKYCLQHLLNKKLVYD